METAGGIQMFLEFFGTGTGVVTEQVGNILDDLFPRVSALDGVHQEVAY